MTRPDWKTLLTPEQYRTLRLGETEPEYSGEYWHCEEEGMYTCAGCGQGLFSSADKFDGGCGWPTFAAPVENQAVLEESDHSEGMDRIEIRCSACEGHLGHLFFDGPTDSGLRYCINSRALVLEE